MNVDEFLSNREGCPDWCINSEADHPVHSGVEHGVVTRHAGTTVEDFVLSASRIQGRDDTESFALLRWGRSESADSPFEISWLVGTAELMRQLATEFLAAADELEESA